ncbi:Protein of unknown function [Seinonella peptonophila]|uniref:DUF2690 domain-containing protein n=1 Tax=Seinonella peptonophila TaxID=112248 RepID=A0A1M4SYH9_9BACL|nr:DUF2690 domain-containing protein [Seinonella peptonophila]SHE37220.1 Protein of unknown function [Seinonella peptonophila]
MLRKLSAGLLVAVIGVFGLFVSFNQAEASQYDGKSPVKTGCHKTGWAPKTKKISYGNITGTLYLMFSSKCKTAWAYVKLNKPLPKGYQVLGFVTRNKDKRIGTCRNGNGHIIHGQTSCYSAMVYDMSPNTSYAQVYIKKPDKPDPLYKTRTSSY